MSRKVTRSWYPVPMVSRTQKRLIFGLATGLLLVLIAVTFYLRTHSLRDRLDRVAVGMSRREAEEILGPPVLDLSRSNGRGHSLVWVDQLWQVDLVTGPDDRIERIGCVPSDSTTRRITNWFRRK